MQPVEAASVLRGYTLDCGRIDVATRLRSPVPVVSWIARCETMDLETCMNQSNDATMLITGATGMIGSILVDVLVGRGAVFRAMVRAPETSAQVGKRLAAHVVHGDFDDADSLQRALAGVDRAFLVTNSSEKTEAQQKRFVAAAAQAGVRHIVKLSQFGAGADSPVRFLRYHAAVEEAIRSSGMTWTFVRPNLILQAYLPFAARIGSGLLQAPIGDARVSVVDARDIAAVAAAALLDRGHAGKTYTVTGPQAVTHAGIAAALSRALHRPIRFESVSAHAFGQALRATGVSTWQADGLLEDYAHYERGEAATVSPDVGQVTGTAPRSVDDFARDHSAEFASDDAAG